MDPNLHLLGTLASGVVMGLWLERLVAAAGSVVLLLLGMAALCIAAVVGQDWAGIALGCMLGARLMAARHSEG